MPHPDPRTNKRSSHGATAHRKPDALDRIIAQNIRRYRVARGLTQHALAAQIGVTFQQLQKYESGTNRVTASRLVLIGLALRVPLVEFVNGMGL